MKFIYKIICCPCYEENLSSYEYLHKAVDFECECDLPSDIYVLTCVQHPFVHDMHIDPTCLCKEMPPTQMCRYVQKRERF